MNRRIFSILTALFISLSVFAQTSIQRIDPPNWWVGMKTNKVNLLVNGKDVKLVTEVKSSLPSVKILGFKPLENPDYLLLSIEIGMETVPGLVELSFVGPKKTLKYSYELKQREKIYPDVNPVNASDNIYLIMPDRFANADPANDVVQGMFETCFKRDSMLCRHGGDLKGITAHLDYIKALGMNAIWLNPVQENNQPDESYHGYAITNHYAVDARLGTLNDYVELSKKAQQDSLKLIMDIVLNHTGNKHYLFQNPPTNDWYHRFDEFTRTSYRATTLMDPYAAKADKDLMQNGWFDKHMPDLNQSNPMVENYLIQNTLWWIETARLKGLRVDTWAYSDQAFAQRWAQAVKSEYVNIAIFGEVWDHGAAIQAWFTQQSKVNTNTKTELPGITDFQFYYSVNDIVTGRSGWTDGVARMYYTLAQDFLYRDPSRQIIFLDNHDLTRFYTMCGKDDRKFKLGLTLLFTLRGWPVLLYGTELMMDAAANPDAKVRKDFPGGWKDDAQNKFTAGGRSAKENEMFDRIHQLANYRHNNAFMHSGKLTQYVPEKGVYVYFRYDEKKTVMVILNAGDQVNTLDWKRFSENIKGATGGKDILSNKQISLSTPLQLEPWGSWVVELN